MTQPIDTSFYVTLTSQKTQEFPDNLPTQFQYRLPQSLWLPGKWKVGLASVFLPGVSNPIPHVVTSHVSSSPPKQHDILPTKPFSIRSIHNLYKGSNTDILFQQYAKAFKSSQSQEFLSKLKTADLQDASNGFDFMSKCMRWMEQDLNKKLPTGYEFADSTDNWRIDVSAQDNYTTWLLRHYNIKSTNRKSVPYLAINLILAKQMGWVVETANNVFAVGPNLLMELPDGTTGVKPDPATCLNAKFTFTQPIHVVDGLLYLCSTFSWRFVNLNEAFDKAIHQAYETPKTVLNVFKPWMTNLSLWNMDLGLDLDDKFVDLPVSPHYWKPTTLSVTLLRGVQIADGVSHGKYTGKLQIDMTSLTRNKTYTVALEWYQKDAWLFNRSNFGADGSGLQVHHLRVEKHTHEQNKTHLIYYHTLTIQFTKTSSRHAKLNIEFDIGFPLSAKYSDDLKDNTFLVLYGVEGHVEQVPDVYDDHPVIPSSHTTTETTTTSMGDKKASTLPKSHGTDNLRPLFLSCNLTKSIDGNKTIMKSVAYNNEKTLIECNPIQFYSMRSYLVDILEVTVTEWNNTIPDFNQDSPVIVTLFFKKKLTESQRKYIKLDESFDRDQLI